MIRKPFIGARKVYRILTARIIINRRFSILKKMTTYQILAV